MEVAFNRSCHVFVERNFLWDPFSGLWVLYPIIRWIKDIVLFFIFLKKDLH